MIKVMPNDVVMVGLGTIPNQIVGREQANKRPCIVIQTLDYSELAVIVPFSSKIPPQPQHFTTVKIQNDSSNGLNTESYALTHQIRTISFQRIEKQMGSLSNIDMNKIKTVLADFLDL
jgi:mRNA interferase MazF